MPEECTFCKPELLETTNLKANSQKEPPKEIRENGCCEFFSIIIGKYLQVSFC